MEEKESGCVYNRGNDRGPWDAGNVPYLDCNMTSTLAVAL